MFELQTTMALGNAWQPTFDATEFKPLASSSPQKYGFGYFILEFDLKSPEVLMCRTNIFPEEVEPITIYVETSE